MIFSSIVPGMTPAQVNAAIWDDDLPETQPREHAVPCRVCGRSTWNVNAVCDRHE